MSVRAGDILDLSYKNSGAGLQGSFKVKANEGNTYDPGGVRTNDDANQITSAGEPLWQQNMKLGMLSVTVINDMQADTANICKQLAGAQTDTTWTFTVINLKAYTGVGMLVGDIVPNVNDSTLALKISMPTVKQL